MNLFEIIALDTESEQPLPVFAKSYDMAVQLYMVWWLHNRDRELPDLEVRKRNSDWPGFDTTLLKNALALDICGIGKLQPDGRWHILAPGQLEEGE